MVSFVGFDYVCDAAARNLYGILIALATYTPASGEQHFIELGTELF